MDLWQQTRLQTACRHETRCQLAARWLKKEGDKLDVKDRMALLKAISDGSDRRDAALKEIGLGKPPEPQTLAGYIEGKVEVTEERTL